MTIAWQAPGARRPAMQPVRWEEEAASLRARPGEWGVIDTVALDEPDAVILRRRISRLKTNAQRLQAGSLAAFRPAGTFETSLRTPPEEDCPDCEGGPGAVHCRRCDGGGVIPVIPPVMRLHVRYIGTTVWPDDGPPVQVGEDGAILAVTPRPPVPRRVPAGDRKPRRRRPLASQAQPRRPDVPQVREWARRNGEPVGQRGRLSYELMARYDAAMAMEKAAGDKRHDRARARNGR